MSTEDQAHSRRYTITSENIQITEASCIWSFLPPSTTHTGSVVDVGMAGDYEEARAVSGQRRRNVFCDSISTGDGLDGWWPLEGQGSPYVQCCEAWLDGRGTPYSAWLLGVPHVTECSQ